MIIFSNPSDNRGANSRDFCSFDKAVNLRKLLLGSLERSPSARSKNVKTYLRISVYHIDRSDTKSSVHSKIKNGDKL